jgi:hypothetical protein
MTSHQRDLDDQKASGCLSLLGFLFVCLIGLIALVKFVWSAV